MLHSLCLALLTIFISGNSCAWEKTTVPPCRLDWELAKYSLVSDLNIHLADGTSTKLEALERPQFFFENVKMVALLCAVNETLDHSYNLQIPLKSK